MAQPCSFKITLDRPDRRYAGGDTIRGSIQILVNSPVKSGGIWFTHCWRAHGIGNQFDHTLKTLQLAEPEVLQPGQELNFDFNVTAPLQPVTQRGRLFSVEHYVQVHISVAWATDPMAEEDYILEPGNAPDQLPVSRQNITVGPAWQPSSQSSTAVGGVIAVLIAVIFVGAFGAFFIAQPLILAALIGVGLVVAAFFVIRDRILKRRLGTVDLKIPHLVTAPGEPWLAELRFQPPRTLRINSIRITLKADESTASGSGSDRKTHDHNAFRQTIPLRDTELLPAGEPVHERLLIHFPETTLFSFEAGDNKVRWSASARIDLPGSPDWTSTVPLQVLPAAFASRIPPAPELLPHWHTASPANPPEEAAADRPASHSPSPGTSAVPANAHASPPTTTIAAVLAEINSHSPHSSARASVIRRAIGQRFTVSITISRSASTIGPAEDDPLYCGGLTVDGTLDGTRQAIRIIALAATSPEIEALPQNTSWLAEVELIDWDTIYHRINARQLP
ncbi:MAG: hypothetical protein ACKO2P_21495 [Planctomycetota bacterium]